MLGLVSVFLFAGYTLVYAAVANGGELAATPWEALRRDASASATDATNGGAKHESTFDKILRGVSFLANPFGSLIP